MMISCDRRTSLQIALMGTGAALATAVLPQGLLAQPRLIAPPIQPMHYSRRLITDMSGGQSISVFRQYEVVFSSFSDGFLIEGGQVNVMVDAPAEVARFAELEKERKEDGLFPMVLDPFGRLQDELEAGADDPTVDEAVDVADEMIANADMAQEDRAQLSGLVASIDEATIAFTAHLPGDLFCPPAQERVAEEAVQLEDGSIGRVVTRFGGERDPISGLMRSAQREVLTEIGEDRRRVREEWELYAI